MVLQEPFLFSGTILDNIRYNKVNASREAVEEAATEMKRDGQGDLAVYHAIVHNDTVVRRLEDEQNQRNKSEHDPR